MIPCWILRYIKPRGYSSAFDAHTDIEKIVKCKSVKELAELLGDANIKNDLIKRTVIEHALNIKIAHVQTNAAIIGVAGTLIGAALGAYLQTQHWANNKELGVSNKHTQQPVSNPVEPVTHGVKPMGVISNGNQGNNKQQDGIKMP